MCENIYVNSPSNICVYKKDYGKSLGPKYFFESCVTGEFMSEIILTAAIARTVETYLF